jgi:hypothetical protein
LWRRQLQDFTILRDAYVGGPLGSRSVIICTYPGPDPILSTNSKNIEINHDFYRVVTSQ